MFHRLLVAYDGPTGAKRALETAVELARRDDAALFALAISPHLPRGAATIGEVEEERIHGELENAWLLAEASRLALAAACRWRPSCGWAIRPSRSSRQLRNTTST